MLVRSARAAVRSRASIRCLSTELKPIAQGQKPDEKVARHRPLMYLNGQTPRKDFENIYVAPNAAVIGDVDLIDLNSVWYGAVLRGDRNGIFLGGMSSVGDKTVINTVSSLSSGFPAQAHIGNYVVIEAGCILTSCRIGDVCKVGMGSTVCEGAMMDNNSVLLPGSVLTSGSFVPSKQVWGGNPAKHVKDVHSDDIPVMKAEAARIHALAQEHIDEFNPHNMAFKDAEQLANRGITV